MKDINKNVVTLNWSLFLLYGESHSSPLYISQMFKYVNIDITTLHGLLLCISPAENLLSYNVDLEETGSTESSFFGGIYDNIRP